MKQILHTRSVKKASSTLVLLAIVFAAFVQCTDKVEITRKYTVMEPVFMGPQEIRASFEILPPDTLKNPGKIYLYNSYIFVNEPGKGLHVIDNLNPRAPQIISFINIPGNYDMAAKGDMLYVDSYIDLVALDISNPLEVKEIARIEEIFLNQGGEVFFDPERGVITGWEEKVVIDVDATTSNGFPEYYFYGGDVLAVREGVPMDRVANALLGTGLTGIGGSMARFTISDDHLYTVDQSSLQVFDISDLSSPHVGIRVDIGWGIETIFPYKENLFLGSQTGMHIFGIKDPDFPLHLSTFEHIRSCDPVVVEDTIAFVTLRGGNTCRTDFANQLDVLDISDLTQPRLLKSYPMSNPHGLGIDQGRLFICEGGFGLKIFEVQDLYTIDDHMAAHYTGMDAYDVIPFNNLLLMIGRDGLYQYDYTNVQAVELLSVLPVYSEQVSP